MPRAKTRKTTADKTAAHPDIPLGQPIDGGSTEHFQHTETHETADYIRLKLASIVDPVQLFHLAEEDRKVYYYILQTPSLFEILCAHLNLEMLSTMISNNELFTLLSPHHLVTLGKLRPEIIKEM